MADTYEQNLAQKSSLTTSDFIRVVGSDNVSYKQSVSNVKNAFGLEVYHIEYAETASISGTRYYSPSISGAIDSIATKGAGRYMVECIRNTSYSDSYNSVTSANMTLIVDVLGASYINVIGIAVNNSITGDIILRRSKSPTWGDWIMMPTRREIDALKNRLLYDDIGSCTSISTLSTALNTKLDSMANNTTTLIRFLSAATFAPFENGVTYLGELRKGGSASYASISFYGLGIDRDIIGSKTTTGSTSAWTFAYAGDKNNKIISATVAANTTKTITMGTDTRMVLHALGSTGNSRGEYIFISYTTTNIEYTAIKTCSDLTLSVLSATQFTIQNNTTYPMIIGFTVYTGSIGIS